MCLAAEEGWIIRGCGWRKCTQRNGSIHHSERKTGDRNNEVDWEEAAGEQGGEKTAVFFQRTATRQRFKAAACVGTRETPSANVSTKQLPAASIKAYSAP